MAETNPCAKVYSGVFTWEAHGTSWQTPLHYAATVELPEMCCLLLESGADPGLEDEVGSGATPL